MNASPGRGAGSSHPSGRFSSWVVVFVVVGGFVVGGLGLIFGPNWPMFWVGGAVVVLGIVLGRVLGIMDDYTE